MGKGKKIVFDMGKTNTNSATNIEDYKMWIEEATSTGNKITFPSQIYQQPSTWQQIWDSATVTEPVKARCYNRDCNNETNAVTELRLGKFLNIKTYICERCLSDLATKVKEELGINPETEEK